MGYFYARWGPNDSALHKARVLCFISWIDSAQLKWALHGLNIAGNRSDLLPFCDFHVRLPAECRVLGYLATRGLCKIHRVKWECDYKSDIRSTARQLGPRVFIAYVNDIWRNTEWTTRFFADDCIIYRKIMTATQKSCEVKRSEVVDVEWSEVVFYSVVWCSKMEW
jgi:hypothetical protein